MNAKQLSIYSAVWYVGTSLVLAAAFYLLTSGGQYPEIARIGGAVWIFILSMIITMPIYIPWLRKKYGAV